MSVQIYVKKRSKNHHWKCPYWNAAQKISARTVVQIVRSEMLAKELQRELLEITSRCYFIVVYSPPKNCKNCDGG